MAEYNGYKSWAQWNVSLWVNNDEPFYREAYQCVQKYGRARAADIMAERYAGQRTPDGARYSRAGFFAALEGMNS